jgi:hypothetical protein
MEWLYCFSRCEQLEGVDIESNSSLRRIESFAFAWSFLDSISVPGSIEFVSGTASLGVRPISFDSPALIHCRDDKFSDSRMDRKFFVHYRGHRRLLSIWGA